MRYISADDLNAKLEFPPLVEALRELFRRGVDEARAIHLSQPLAEGRRNDWLLLPAWQFDRHMGIKLASVFPGNEAKGLASIQGLYVLFDGTTGLPLATIDGAAITLWKTAANSALAADLSCPQKCPHAPDGRRRRAGALSRARPLRRASHRRGHDLEPHGRECRAHGGGAGASRPHGRGRERSQAWPWRAPTSSPAPPCRVLP